MARRYIKCRQCHRTIRTRSKHVQEAETCKDCTWNNIKKGLPITKENAHELHWVCMREEWFHELLYAQVEQNGFIALGLGRLSFLDEKQRSHRTKGRYTSTHDGYNNEYDLFLKTADKQVVVVEIKKEVKENAIAQTLRYSRSLKDEGHDPIMVLIGVEFPDRTLASLRELIELGWNLRAFFITPSPRGFQLVRIMNGQEKEDQED